MRVRGDLFEKKKKKCSCCINNPDNVMDEQKNVHGEDKVQSSMRSDSIQHQLVPVLFFFVLPPSSPFCFFLCSGRTRGNHFSGISLSTVILA